MNDLLILLLTITPLGSPATVKLAGTPLLHDGVLQDTVTSPPGEGEDGTGENEQVGGPTYS